MSEIALKNGKAPTNETGLGKYKSFIWIAVGIIAAIIIVTLNLGLSTSAQRLLALFVFVISLWIGEVMPTGMAALLWAGLVICIIGTKAIPAATVFSGFSNSTLWLMVGALLLGEATTQTRLAHRIAYKLMSLGGTSYIRVIMMLWIANMVLALIVPSGAVKMAIFIPIMMGIAAAYKAEPNSKFTANLMMNVYWSGMASEALILTSTNLNLTSVGILQQATGISISWIGWFLVMLLPSAIMMVGVFLIINKLFKPEETFARSEGGVEGLKEKLEELGPLSSEEIRTAALFTVTVLMWVFESVIHIPAAWVAVFAAAILFVPKIGVLNSKALNSISWNTVLMMGVALGMGSVMSAVGINTWLSDKLLTPLFEPLAHLGSFGIVLGIGLFAMIMHIVIPSGSALTAAAAPLLMSYSVSSGFNPVVVALALPRACSQLLLFPYQSVPIMVLWGTNFMDTKKFVKMSVVIVGFLLIWEASMGVFWDWASAFLM